MTDIRKRQIQTRVHLSLLVTIVQLLLVACSDPAPDRLSDNRTAQFTVRVDKALVKDEPSCFDTNDNINALAYLYTGTPSLPSDLTGAATDPIQRIPITPQDLNYAFSVEISESGAYSIAVVCNVIIDNPSRVDKLTYMNHRTYVVSIKNSVGLINEINKPPGHLEHGILDIGIVCYRCHFDNPPQYNFLLTTVEHGDGVLSTDCVSCHSSTGLAVAPSVNHITTPGMLCSDCHVTTKWLRVQPVDHDVTTNACGATSCTCNDTTCHQYQKTPTHSTSTYDICLNCHITTSWIPF